MTADVELLPCPFCGGGAEAETYVVEAQVVCLSCRAKIVRQHGARDDNGLSESIAAWNARANVLHHTAAKDAEIELLRAEIAKWKGLHGLEQELRKGEARRAERLEAGNLAYTQQVAELIGRAGNAEARAERMAEALHRLTDACDDSDGAQYGTLSTTFVRGVCEGGLEENGN